MFQIESVADQIQTAAKNGQARERFTAAYPDFTLDQGFTVQELLQEKAKSKGLRVAGYKMGLTSQAKIAQVGLKEPIYGFLTNEMGLPSGGTFSLRGKIHPKIEPELAFITSVELKGNPTEEEARSAVAKVAVALEILDSRYENYEFQMPDLVADNCSACGYVMGTEVALPAGSLSNLDFTLEKNGRPILFGSSAEVFGNPILSIMALVRVLHSRGRTLPAGSIVLSGGVAGAIPLEAGDWIRGKIEGIGMAEVRVEK